METNESTLDLVLETLSVGGYRRERQPLRVVDLSFEFDAVFSGPGRHHALVLVVKQLQLDEEALLRRLTRLNLALTRSHSRRPVALIVIAPRPDAAEPARLDDLQPFAHIHLVPPGTGPERIKDLLRALLPLVLPEPLDERTRSEVVLKGALEEKGGLPEMRSILRAGRVSADVVEREFLDRLEATIQTD